MRKYTFRSLLLVLILETSTIYSQSKSVEIWIRSFIPDIPNAGAASSNIKANPNGSGSLVEVGQTVINGTNYFRLCFATDNRGFSSSPSSTARTDTKFTIKSNPDGSVVVVPANARTTPGITKRLDCVTGGVLEQMPGKVNMDVLGAPAVADDIIQVIGQVAATDQLVPYYPTWATPSADCSFDLKWNRSTTELSVDFTYGTFPAFEIYARQPGNDWVTVFQQLPTHGPWLLAGDGTGFEVVTVRKSVTVKVPGLSGRWQSPAPEQRFNLEITGSKVKWSERSSSGVMLVKEVPIQDLGDGNFKIERPNDNEVLTFLGFQQSLRNEILARGPKPSFIVFHKEGSTIKGEWNGLIATKDENAHLRELIQPGVRPPKVFIFNQIP